jgi:hypothetical protein
MKRCRNSATAADVAKTLRGTLPKGADMKLVYEPDIEILIGNFSEILCDTLRLTPRPTQKLFKDAAMQAWDFESGEGDLFGNRMAQAVIHCRVKKNQSTTGKKMPPGVFKVVEALKLLEQNPPEKTVKRDAKKLTTGQNFANGARRLLKKASDEMSDGHASPALEVPVPKGASSGGSSSSSGISELNQLKQLYGTQSKQPDRHMVVDLLSSQEEEDVPFDEADAAAGATARPQKFVEHFDSSICKVVRDYADGTRQEAKMQPGPTGMATATFEGEEQKSTECPNLLVQKVVVVCKKPAAAQCKKKRGKRVEKESDSSGDAAVSKDGEAEKEEEVDETIPKIKKHLLYSKIYHREKKASVKSGKTIEEAKAAASTAGKAAVAAAKAAGTLAD